MVFWQNWSSCNIPGLKTRGGANAAQALRERVRAEYETVGIADARDEKRKPIGQPHPGQGREVGDRGAVQLQPG